MDELEQEFLTRLTTLLIKQDILSSIAYQEGQWIYKTENKDDAERE